MSARRGAMRPFALGVLVGAWALVGCAACSRAASTDARRRRTRAPVAAADAALSAGRAEGPTTWAGKYAAVPGALFVPDGGEWSGWKFHGDDASVGLGDGTITLVIDEEATGRRARHGRRRARRAFACSAGRSATASTTAHIGSSDPLGGFSGTAVGQRAGGAAHDGDAIQGTMRLSLATGNVIREASFSLAKK